MNLSQLYYFRKLAELQHYTKAAKELYITQPSLSDSIASLEKELGIALFQKEGRNIRLTKHGQEFYTYVCSALGELEKGIEAAREKAGAIGGVIDVGCIPTLCGDFLPKATNGYKQARNPKITFNIYTAMSLPIIEAVKSGEYDVGFCSKVDHEPDLEFIPILAQELVAIINHSHPLSSGTGTPVSFEELASHSLVTYRQSIPIGGIVAKLLAGHGLTASYQFEDEISMAGFVSTNPAVGIAANTAFLRQFDSLAYRKLNVRADTRLVYMAYSKKNYKTKALESFIEYVKSKEASVPL